MLRPLALAASCLLLTSLGTPPSLFCPGDGSVADCPCSNNGVSPTRGCDNAQSTGGVEIGYSNFQPDMMGGGTVVITGSYFNPNAQVSIIIIRSTGTTAHTAFGDGLMCISTPVSREGYMWGINGSSSLKVTHDSGAGTFYYQLWYRNLPATFCTPDNNNLSSGLAITW